VRCISVSFVVSEWFTAHWQFIRTYIRTVHFTLDSFWYRLVAQYRLVFEV